MTAGRYRGILLQCKQSSDSHPAANGLQASDNSDNPCWAYDIGVGACKASIFHLLSDRRGYKAISDNLINGQIREKEVRVTGVDGESLGVMPIQEAQRLADEAEVDLVLIAPTAKPPVCRLVDYGKYCYEQKRREKEQKKKQHEVEIKEIRLSPNIDTNDLNTKVTAARKFLSKGNRVKMTLRFRGREMAHMANSKHILDDIATELADVATVEKAAKVEGRSMTMFLAAKK